MALLPLSLLMSIGTFVGSPWPVQFSAYLVASLLASGFSVMAVTAIQGLLILTAPRGRLLAVSAALRSAMLCVLVIALPLVLRLPAQAGSFAAGSRWLYAAPPVWFLGVERWLLGDVSRAYVIPLTAIAGAAVASAAALAVGSYVYLYRRFDRVLVRPVPASARADRRLAWHPLGAARSLAPGVRRDAHVHAADASPQRAASGHPRRAVGRRRRSGHQQPDRRRRRRLVGRRTPGQVARC